MLWIESKSDEIEVCGRVKPKIEVEEEKAEQANLILRDLKVMVTPLW